MPFSSSIGTFLRFDRISAANSLTNLCLSLSTSSASLAALSGRPCSAANLRVLSSANGKSSSQASWASRQKILTATSPKPCREQFHCGIVVICQEKRSERTFSQTFSEFQNRLQACPLPTEHGKQQAPGVLPDTPYCVMSQAQKHLLGLNHDCSLYKSCQRGNVLI